MTLYKRGGTWWYSFFFAGRRIQESSKSNLKTLAQRAFERRRRELQEGFLNIKADRRERIQTVKHAATEYLKLYAVRHPASSPRYMKYCVRHIVDHLGTKMIIDVTEREVFAYQNARLQAGASGKSINEEVGVLLRLLEERGDVVRIRMRKSKTLKLPQNDEVGKALSENQETALLHAAKKARLPMIHCALMVGLNAGMRDKEIRTIKFAQLDLNKRILVVGKSKTRAGTGRTIPLNKALFTTMTEYINWYRQKIGVPQPDHHLFPFGRSRHWDPTKPITSFKTTWRNLKHKTGIAVRFHDLRHTCGTKLAESGASDETIMAIMGHVTRRMLTHYSHIRTEHKRNALEAIASPTTI
jgi:integrase